MDVFHVRLDDEGSLFGQSVEGAKFRKQSIQFFPRQQSDAFKHGDVGDGAQNVERSELQIQFPVLSDRESVDPRIRLESFIPKFCHDPICFVPRLDRQRLSFQQI